MLLPFLLLIGVSIVSVAYSWNPGFGTVKTVQLVEFCLVFLLTVSMLRDPRWMRRTLIAYVVSCVVLALIVIGYAARTGIHASGANIAFYQKNAIGMFLLVLARMSGLVRQEERAVARQRALRRAGVALVGAADIDQMEDAAKAAVRELAGLTADARLISLHEDRSEDAAG